MSSPASKQAPCTSRGAERRAVLFEVATELFIQQGYDTVSLDQIVEHAGGSKATIYKYFGNKEGLFLAICEERCNTFIKAVEQACQLDALSVRDTLIALLTNLFQIFTDEKGIAFKRLIIQVSTKKPDLAHDLYHLGPARAHKLLAQFLKQAHDKQQLFCENPDDSAVYFFGFLHDIHWRVILGLPVEMSPEQLQQHIEYIVERFLNGHQLPKHHQKEFA